MLADPGETSSSSEYRACWEANHNTEDSGAHFSGKESRGSTFKHADRDPKTPNAAEEAVSTWVPAEKRGDVGHL